jgi:hypothetical protein
MCVCVREFLFVRACVHNTTNETLFVSFFLFSFVGELGHSLIRSMIDESISTRKTCRNVHIPFGQGFVGCALKSFSLLVAVQ